jgi:WD40 repeat protein
LASSSYNGTILIWDLEIDEIAKLKNSSDSVFTLDFSPDGTKLSAGGSNTSWIWDLEKGFPQIVTTLKHPDTRINSLDYSSDGEFLALGASDNTIWIIDTKTGEIVSRLGGHEGNILDVEFSTNGQYLASGSTDSSVRVWNILENSNTGIKFVALLSIKFQDWINDISFSPDRKHIAVSAFGSEITFWELPSGTIADVPLGQRWFQPLSIDFSPQVSQTKLAIGSSSCGIEVRSVPGLQ